jgi:hypothetical protein
MRAVNRGNSGDRRYSARLAVIAVSALVLLPGCGGGGAKSQVQSTVRDYYSAIIDGKGDKACSLLTQSQQRRLAALTRKDDDCVEYLTNSVFPTTGRRFFQIGGTRVFKKDIADLPISVKVNGDRATAKAGRAKGSFGLTKVGGQWKISYLSL